MFSHLKVCFFKINDYLCTMKALVMVRASTEAQSIEDQHNEMLKFCQDEGYDDIVFVEDKGASAIKLNDQYRLMIDQVKEEIARDSSIRCFAVWELSRAFRNELVFQEVKMFLVERRVQFLVKNPYLKLLNPDGSVNNGMEVAVTLMATLAKQEMELKKERFHRAKSAMWNQGKFIGGTVKFGYRVDDDGYIVFDEEKAKLVRMVFDMYATGKYSVRSLYDELIERGYDISFYYVNNIISDRAYIDSPYPQMVSQELWDRCEEIRKRNYISIPKGRRYCFGSGIFKCSVCGRAMIAEGAQYRCWHHNKYSSPPHCDNGLTIRVENLDGLLWYVASVEEITYRMRMDQDRREEYEKEVVIMREKVAAARKKLEYVDEKRRRIQDLYLEGMIDKEEMKKRHSGTISEVKEYNDTILKLEEKIKGFLQLLQGDDDSIPDMDKITGIYTGVLSEGDLKMMDGIVKKHISRVITTAYWFGRDRDKRADRENAQLVEIETVYGGIKKYVYVARKYKKHHFWLYSEDGKETPLFTVKKIERAPLGELHPRAFKKFR